MYVIEKGKLTLTYFINQTTYFEASRHFVPPADAEKFGTLPAFQETKAFIITNLKLGAEN